ncbi:DUF58 domain-containing protein [Methylocapsa sp. D3K7]|uniref:DUF58 domain-containing protein n=1 Tax=Methylocapsa sp. D3K7 TaxID=3041435 RepID=UPI00244E98E0|nr:DUF58 domain-containing protein [Methylocapsa sp. D3K7]WGJ16205.1 DUF58 domain-containing protein [Methylocapsa sp. D3K7]
MTGLAEIAYRPRGTFANAAIGTHRSKMIGGDGVFRDQALFWCCPDARRIDIRATLNDPFGETYVRRFEQRRAIDVYALVDLSGSMRYEGSASKLALSASLCVSLAYSVTRIGDRFGLIGCDERIREDVFLPATRVRRAAVAAGKRLLSVPCYGSSVEGLLDAAVLLGGRRKLVLLISDFRQNFTFLEKLFDALSLHDVAPICLVDPDEENLPHWGLTEIADLESGRRRLIVLRPSLRARWLALEVLRRRALERLSARYGRGLYTMKGQIDSRDLTRYLLSH